MKKILRILILLLVIALWAATATASDGENRIILDGTDIGAATGDLLPLRDIAVRTGGTVEWVAVTRQIIVRRGGRTIRMTTGSTLATVNGSPVTLAAPPVLAGGRTLLPLCFYAEHMGLGAGHMGGAFILSTTPAQRVPVLTYHHILPDEVNTRFRENPWTVSTEEFAAQMRYLRDNGFYTPTLCELEAFLYRGWPLPAKSVMIHFDDGYYSNYVYAYPILQRYGLRAVLFPITGHSERLGEYQPPICHDSLTHAAAVTLRAPSDVFETASHTHNMHSNVPGTEATGLMAGTREEIIADTRQSFEFLTNHRAFAYPRGQFNDYVIDALREAGITMAFTVNRGYVTSQSDPFRLNRFTVYRGTRMARFRDIVNGRA